MLSTAVWQICLHSFSDTAMARRPMLRSSRTHKVGAATFEAAEPATEALTNTMVVVEDVRRNANKERYIAS
jgi:hypothetical protein